jgi:predicted chitinase
MPDLDTNEPDDLQAQREEIARVAYSYWQSRGCEDGHDVEDWLMAEEEVLSRQSPRRASYQVKTAA